MRPCPPKPKSVTLQVCHSPSVIQPLRSPPTHSQLTASLTYPIIAERGDSHLRAYSIDSCAPRLSACFHYGEALSGRDNSSAQAGEKGSGIGSLTANSSLSGPQGPGTFVEQSAVMASSGPQGLNLYGPLSMATAPCTGPHTSLFRQFAPEMSLPF